MKILLLTKTTPWCHLVQEVLRKSGHDVAVVTDLGPDYPRQAYASYTPQRMIHQDEWRGDLIISYLYPRVLTRAELERAPRAINFHPGPPNHPGFAPYSWAIYEMADHIRFKDRVPDYGVTAHYMKTKVDTGLILRTKYFPMRHDDSVIRLQHRTMRHLFALFMGLYEEGFPHLVDNDFWRRKSHTKAEFEALRNLGTYDAYTDEDGVDNIENVIRACRYPGQPGAYFEGEAS